MAWNQLQLLDFSNLRLFNSPFSNLHCVPGDMKEISRTQKLLLNSSAKMSSWMHTIRNSQQPTIIYSGTQNCSSSNTNLLIRHWRKFWVIRAVIKPLTRPLSGVHGLLLRSPSHYCTFLHGTICCPICQRWVLWDDLCLNTDSSPRFSLKCGWCHQPPFDQGFWWSFHQPLGAGATRIASTWKTHLTFLCDMHLSLQH